MFKSNKLITHNRLLAVVDNKHAIGSDFCCCKAQKVHACARAHTHTHTHTHTHNNYIQQTPAVVECKHLLLLSNLCLPCVVLFVYYVNRLSTASYNDCSAIRIGPS